MPDAWVYPDEGWTLCIESKVALNVDINQLPRHMKTAEWRTYVPRQVAISLEAATSPLTRSMRGPS
ncbi:hypothetical protein Rmet_6493 [Cupriavidus metallidurans CH34]|uniref:Uncharacterized protein n=1 Tax=Cupriavidus metallidurans (strain ATCC 43123 / DSM 2839 / NBRC 102507 / CH34) TaxID=266264 RepID=D3DXT1_CUPMC|nr:hypothetical protein Rmet_6493 [Cupriavidus metallidurans CH34]